MSQNHNENRNELLPIEENGKTYWRSLDHVAGTPEFQKLVAEEFPEGASELTDPVSRRSFMQLMGASVALAGFGTGCVRRPEEKILPYARRPEDLVPGLPQFYATTMSYGDTVTGLVVEAHEGRPTKIEGNRLHPASQGAACTFEQAAILSLYDPDRTVRVLKNGEESTFSAFDQSFDGLLGNLRSNGGRGLVIVSEASASPTFAAVRQQMEQALPQARFFEWEAISNENVLAGTRLAFGQALEPVYRIERADAIVAVDADLFGSGPFHLRYSRDWAQRRAPDAPGGMNRLYAVEPVFTVTGAAADHRLRLRASQVGPFLRALAAELQKQGVSIPAGIAQAGGEGAQAKFVQALAKDLAGKRGKSVVAVGRHQAPAVQAIAWAINDALGNVGETIRFATPASVPAVAPTEAIRAATQALQGGQVDTLVVLGGNPAYDAPADVPFAEAMKQAKNTVHLTVAPNETSALAQWVVPETHFLEEWGDALALDGTYSIVQPLVRPIWDGRSKIEFLSRIAGKQQKGYDLVRSNFLASRGGEEAWRKTLHDGVLEGSSGQFVEAQLTAGAIGPAVSRLPAPGTGVELVFLVDNKMYDGRFANNGWLQELPEPLTKLTWSNAALVSPKLAEKLGLKTGQMVKLQAGERAVEAAVWVQPGTAEETIGLALGYGRKAAGRVGTDRGFDAYQLRTSQNAWFASGVSVTPVAGEWLMAATQDHHSMEGRPLIREASIQEYEQNPYFAREMVQHPPLLALWKQHEYTGQQWGMSIDLNACVGCNGCMIACQAENNIPIVGPEQTRMGREMHWIRLDRYFAASGEAADLDDAEVLFQPMTCQQCENAPCENVCPVAATVHSKDGGLNDMVYNRCIGTRYCSNNCPYKVRRFNFFDWHTQGLDAITDVEKMKFNPDVTVRTRGVMEKCTYCVQRINAAKRDAKLSGFEKVPDGAITPACAQACPTEAIVMGDVNDPNSRVSKLKQQPRNYEVLAELNTKPRTSYLARIRNPNPELVS